MDIVLPVSAKHRSGNRSDLHRLKILLASAEKFWFAGDRILIITPDTHVVQAEIGRIAPERIQVEVLHDDDVFAGFPKDLSSWWKQQVLKLAANKFVRDDFYLVLDADCFFVRPTHAEDLIQQGRGRVHYGEGCAYSRMSWYRGCEKLGLPTLDKCVNVTPFVMNATLAQNALGFVLGQPAGVRSIGKLGWSEYTLYQSVAVRDGLWAAHHYATDSHFLGNEVWVRSELPSWDASKSFDHPNFHITLVQSNTGVTADWVWERVGQYLVK